MDESYRFITASGRDESVRKGMATARTRVDSAKEYVDPWPSSISTHLKVPTRDEFVDLLNNHRKKVPLVDPFFLAFFIKMTPITNTKLDIK